jgi:phosphonate transport system permease protein
MNDEPTGPSPAPVLTRCLGPQPLAPPTRHRRSRPQGVLFRFRGLIIALVVAVAVSWALRGTGVGLSSLIEGRHGAVRILTGMVPPNLSGDLLGSVVTAVVETFQISIAGLAFGAVIGLPLAMLIAGNVQAPSWLASSARLLATSMRSVPELLWALIFVSVVGLGPAAGVYAISLHAAGMLAKLGSEQLEAVDPAPVEAIRLTGASRADTAVLAILPQARNNIASLLLYQWECNIRSSAVIGFVGAGGIGQALGISLHLFRYQEMATLLVALLLMVISVDRISRSVRRRLGAAVHSADMVT